MVKENRPQSLLSLLICAVLVMAAALFVRMPGFTMSAAPAEYREAYLREDGIPYLCDPDSYYHMRLAEEALSDAESTSRQDAGRQETADENLDPLRYYPDGWTADYQPGIVRLTILVYRILNPLFGTSLYLIEVWLAAAMAAFAAFAAFFAGRRLSGNAGGFGAGIFIGCAPCFALRTVVSRYDTDMFVVLFDILLIALLGEALSRKDRRKRILCILLFALSAALYTDCWSFFSLAFFGLAILGGAAYLLYKLLRKQNAAKESATFVLAGILSLLGILLLQGWSFLTRFLQLLPELFAIRDNGLLPNLRISVSEMKLPVFSDAVSDLGGIAVILLAAAGLIFLLMRVIRSGKNANTNAPHFFILLVFLAGCLFALRYGVRFLEHLIVPLGLLAGAGLGGIAKILRDIAGRRLSGLNLAKQSHAERIGTGTRKPVRILAACLVILLCALAAISPVKLARTRCEAARPAISDSYAEALAWIRENADDPKAPVVSWWDGGYFITALSGHPTLWDGGSMEGGRAILLGTALTTENLQQSRNLIRMLCLSGDASFTYLTDRLPEKQAFAAVKEAAAGSADGAVSLLQNAYGLSENEAKTAADLIFPTGEKEIYVLFGGEMTKQTAWYAYYAGWDFAGGSDSNAFEEEKSVFRRLFSAREGEGFFEKTFETHDGVRRTEVWRIL